jgi:hypothetical protein
VTNGPSIPRTSSVIHAGEMGAAVHPPG